MKYGTNQANVNSNRTSNKGDELPQSAVELYIPDVVISDLTKFVLICRDYTTLVLQCMHLLFAVKFYLVI